MSDRDRLYIYQNYVDQYGIKRKNIDEDFKEKKDTYVWQPRRACYDDWILCVWVQRYTRMKFEIGLFLAEDHTKFVKGAGVMAGLVFCLSDAYHKIGKMEIIFKGKRKNSNLESGYEPDIPVSIRNLSKSLGVELSCEDRITDSEGQLLYVRLTGLSENVSEFLKDKIRACFIIQRGIWSKEQIEILVQESVNPEKILNGGLPAEMRLFYLHDLLILRQLIMGERVMTYLSIKGLITKIQWIFSRVLCCTSDKKIKLRDIVFKKNEKIYIYLIPRCQDGYNFHLLNDISHLRKKILVAVTYDAKWVNKSTEESVTNLIARKKIKVFPIVDTLAEIDEEIQKRLKQSISTKRALQERAE